MASKPKVASPPNSNPKLGDYFKAASPSAKPPTAGRTQPGGLAENRKK